MPEIKNIVVLGAGNVATHLGLALKDAGNDIIQVYSRTERSASMLAAKLKSGYTTILSEIDKSAEMYILSVSDDAVQKILDQFCVGNKLIVHTSGFHSMEILKRSSENFGVFYPLQTFSKIRKLEMQNIPICIEGNKPENVEKLKSIAGQISNNVSEINSEQRRVLHLAAVFACNFPNFMYIIAEKIAMQASFDFNILRPLIKETADKAIQIGPIAAQTGPAFRGDDKIMEAHLEMLKAYPVYREFYGLISKEINKLATK